MPLSIIMILISMMIIIRSKRRRMSSISMSFAPTCEGGHSGGTEAPSARRPLYVFLVFLLSLPILPIWTGGAIGDGCEGHTPGNSSPASQMVLHTSVPEVRRPSIIRHPFVFRRVCPLLWFTIIMTETSMHFAVSTPYFTTAIIDSRTADYHYHLIISSNIRSMRMSFFIYI